MLGVKTGFVRLRSIRIGRYSGLDIFCVNFDIGIVGCMVRPIFCASLNLKKIQGATGESIQ